MRVNEAAIQRLAEAIVGALTKQGFVHPKVTEATLVERVARVIMDSAKAEQTLEEEATRLAEKHSRQLQGMDLRKIIQGIKERLAKERGFPL